MTPTIAVTRAVHQAAEMTSLLEDAGANVLLYPAIAISPPEDPSDLDAALQQASAWDWIIFTSANAVEAVAQRLEALKLPAESLRRANIAAVGPATARAVENRLGLRVDLTPPKAVGESLLDALPIVPRERVLLPRAAKARDVLPDGLRDRGADIHVVTAYQTVLGQGGDDLPAALRAQQVHAVTFTSPSTVHNTLRRLQSEAGLGPDALNDTLIACIGPVTAEAATKAGLNVDVMPSTYTVPALVQTLMARF